jgi:hypothetical protein
MRGGARIGVREHVDARRMTHSGGTAGAEAGGRSSAHDGNLTDRAFGDVRVLQRAKFRAPLAMTFDEV